MTNRLFQVINTFDKNDWTLVKKNISQKYANDSQLVELLGLLYKYRSRIISEKINSDYLHEKAFGRLTKKSFLNLFSILQKEIIEILTINVLKAEKNQWNSAELKVLRDRGLYDWHDTISEKYQGNDDRQLINRYTNFWTFKNNIDTYASNHPVKTSNGKEALHFILEYWEKTKADMELFIQILATYRQEVFREDWSALKIDGKSVTPQTPLQKAMKCLITIRTQKDHEARDYIRSFLTHNADHLSDDLKTLFAFGLGTYFREQSDSLSQRAKDTFEIQNYMDENGILLVNSKIEDVVFINYINLAASPLLQKFEEAEKFIIKYQKHLIRNKEEIVSIAQAIIAISKEKHEEALEVLTQVNPSSHHNKSYCYRLELFIFVDLGYEEDFIRRKLTNASSYFKRNESQFSTYTSKMQADFIEAIQLLMNNEYEDLKMKLDNGVLVPSFISWFYSRLSKGGTRPLHLTD